MNFKGLGSMMSTISALSKNAGEITEKMKEGQAKMAEMKKKVIVEGESGAGLVMCKMNLDYEVVFLDFKDDFLQQEQAVVKELIAGAINHASRKVAVRVKEETMKMLGDLGLPAEMMSQFPMGN